QHIHSHDQSTLRLSPLSPTRRSSDLGWKTSKSSSFSPVEANMIGAPVTLRTLSAAPPRASPSSLVSTTPVNPTPSRNASAVVTRSEEHTSELQSRENLVCRLLLEKKT